MTDSDQNSPPVIGIVGGLASGKSTVARMLGDRGAAVIDADRTGHEVLRRPEIRNALKEAFGGGILNEQEQIDRQRLAETAFGEPEQLRKLNSIVHPPIIEEINRKIDRLKQKSEVPLIVLDAALLVEVGLHETLCDALLFVDAPRETRLRRAAEQREMTCDQFERRTTAQMDPREKKELADYVIDNAGSLAELNRQINHVWPTLCGTAARARSQKPTN